MTLTPLGVNVYERAIKIQQLNLELDTVRLYYQNFDSLNLAFSHIHIYHAFELIKLQRFKDSHPNVIIKLHHNKLRNLVQYLHDQQVDMYVASYMHNPVYPNGDALSANFLSKEIDSLRYSLIVHPELVERYFGNDSTELIELWRNGADIKAFSSLPFVLLSQIRTPIYLDAMEREYPVHLVAEADNVHTVLEMVTLKYGFSIIPKISQRPHKSFLEFPLAAPTSLLTQKIMCFTSEIALEQQAVKDLWDMVGQDKT